MSALASVPESGAFLHNIRWETYARMLDDLASHSIRLTFDRGDLEIVSPSHRHEAWKKLAARMIESMTEELGLPIKSGGFVQFFRSYGEMDETTWIRSFRAWIRDEVAGT